jgi:2-amino-4-hydroxy-6-hydroxymethyldihydropteridine diphosphokinase
MDKVFIEGLEIEALIGIYDWERRIRQPLVFDLEMAFDNRRPAASDAIGDTLDYKAVSKRLIAYVSQSSFGLVETLAERCAAIVLHEFDVEHVRLKLSKPGAVRGARAVGVLIERSRATTPPLPTEEVAPATARATTQPSPTPGQEAKTPVAPVAETHAPLPPGIESEASAPGAPLEPVGPIEPSRAAPRSPIDPTRAAPAAPAPVPSRADAMIAAISGNARNGAPKPAPAPSAAAPANPSKPESLTARTNGPTCPAYLSLGSNIEPEKNLRMAITALRARFGDVRVSPVYRTRAVGFVGPDFLNAIAVVQSDVNPFALHKWLHRLEEAQGRDRRDAAYSNRPLDVDIIYFGDLVLDGPGEFQLPRPELRHAFVLKPLADVAPDFVDPIRNTTLAQLWKIHPEHATPPERVELAL